MVPDIVGNWRRLSALKTLIQREAVTIKPPGEFFTLKNGGQSRWYLDLRKIMLDSGGLYLTLQCLSYLLTTEKYECQAIGGPCVGADPIVGAMIYGFGQCGAKDGTTSTRGYLVRKEEKNHGLAGLVIGSVRPGDTCLLLEDTTTTGGSMMLANNALEAFGARVTLAVAVVDRSSGAAEKLFAEKGIKFKSLLTHDDLQLDDLVAKSDADYQRRKNEPAVSA